MAIEGTLTHTQKLLSIFPDSIGRALLEMTQLFTSLGHLNEPGSKYRNFLVQDSVRKVA